MDTLLKTECVAVKTLIEFRDGLITKSWQNTVRSAILRFTLTTQLISVSLHQFASLVLSEQSLHLLRIIFLHNYNKVFLMPWHMVAGVRKAK